MLTEGNFKRCLIRRKCRICKKKFQPSSNNRSLCSACRNSNTVSKKGS